MKKPWIPHFYFINHSLILNENDSYFQQYILALRANQAENGHHKITLRNGRIGINTLTLANKTYALNLIQGPLAGISCAPFRVLTTRFSQPAFSCTEMISCKTLLQQSASSRKRLVMKDDHEGPLCFQLSASHPEELAQATKMVTDLGADGVDLNCGCPVKKIRRKGEGSSLLTDPRKLYHLITAMKQNTTVPVSIKIRVEGSGEAFHDELLKVITEAGADAVVVHGRHWTEHYETACRHESIAFFVRHLKIPVIGNGDVRCLRSLKQMLATGCAGVMISRAGVGQPWLIRQLMAEVNQEPFSLPSLKEIGAIFIEHVLGLMRLIGSEKFSILQARQLAKYYARPLPMAKEFCMAVNSCENLAVFRQLCERYFIINYN